MREYNDAVELPPRIIQVQKALPRVAICHDA
jgi:hypothetical protein